MKQLTTVVKPFRAEAVLRAIAELDVTSCAVREAKGYSRQKGYLDRYLGSEYSTAFLPKIEISVCVSCQVQRAGPALDLLYADPDLFHNGRPTRSGIPILFPFPNRIRDGRYSWDGKSYQLPLNDPTRLNAIHGFACRHPWRVAGHG